MDKNTIKHSSRNWTKAALILIAAGTLLIGIGFLVDGRGSVYLDERGLHITPTGYANEVQTHSLQTFTSVDLSASSADIELIPSDKYMLEMRLPDGVSPEWDISGGKLTVNTNDQISSSWSFGLMDIGFSFTETETASEYVKVYYPSSATLDQVAANTLSADIYIPQTAVNSLRVQSSSGEVNIQALDFQDASVTTVSGDIDLNGAGKNASVLIKTSSGDIETTLNGCADISLSSISSDISLNSNDASVPAVKASSSSGEIEIDGAAWKDVSVNNTTGDIRITGKLQNKTQLQTDSGEITLAIYGKISDYAYDLSSLSGDIRLDGKSLEQLEDSFFHLGSGDSANKEPITAKSTNGDILIDFLQY